MRTLTVTADDFGASSDVNAAVIETHRGGIVTSASLMVTGPAAEEAVRLARAHPTLSVGLHLVLADGRPSLPANEVPDLVSPEGNFPRSPTRAGLRMHFSRAARAQVRREVAAQLQAFRRTGLPLAHVDGHHHLHMHPIVLSALAELAGEYDIPSIRLPAEELAPALATDPVRAPRNLLWSAIFRCLSIVARRRMRRAGVRFADRVYGLLGTGRIDERYLLALVPRMRGRRVELYAHPSASPSRRGSAEREALMSARVRRAVESAGFALGAGA